MKKLFFTFFYTALCAGVLWGQGWVELGTGNKALKANNNIAAVCTDSGGIVYAAGSFTDTTWGDSTFLGTTYVAKWDGVSWSRLGGYDVPFSGGYSIFYIGVDPAHNVYANGGFIDSNGYYYVARWDGVAWGELGTGSHALNAADANLPMCMDHKGHIYVGGVRSTDTSSLCYVARWDGASWDTLGTGSNAFFPQSTILSMCADDSGNVYIAGQLYDSACSYVMKWDGRSWSKLGVSSAKLIDNTRIGTLYADDAGNVYAGGSFTDTNGYHFVAKWDGTAWSELGTGSNALNANSTIWSLCMDPAGYLYATGQFSDSNNRSYVAQWNGVKWHELGTGRNAIDYDGGPLITPAAWIFAVCSDAHGNIYAGGSFTDTTVMVSPYGNSCVKKYGEADEGITPAASEGIVNVYPNPAGGTIKISIISGPTGGGYRVMDMTGRTISAGMLGATDTTIDISALTPGLYLLQLDNYPGNIFKIIKK
jgi:hypothetical protein